MVIGHIGPVVAADHLVAGVVLPHPGVVQGGDRLVQGSLTVLTYGIALGHGLVVEGGDGGQIVHRPVQQMVIPGVAGFLVIDLVLGVLGIIKTGLQAIHGVLQGVLIHDIIVVLQVGRGILGVLDGDSGHGPLDQSAVQDQGHSDSRHTDDADHSVQDGAAAVSLLFALALLDPLVRPLAGLTLAGLLFSGCTHS